MIRKCEMLFVRIFLLIRWMSQPHWQLALIPMSSVVRYKCVPNAGRTFQVAQQHIVFTSSSRRVFMCTRTACTNRSKCNRVWNSSMRRAPGTTENKIHIMKFNFHISHEHYNNNVRIKHPHICMRARTHTQQTKDTNTHRHRKIRSSHESYTERFIEREIVALDAPQTHVPDILLFACNGRIQLWRTHSHTVTWLRSA